MVGTAAWLTVAHVSGDRAETARFVRRRQAEERRAAWLESRGWLCVTPELAALYSASVDALPDVNTGSDNRSLDLTRFSIALTMFCNLARRWKPPTEPGPYVHPPKLRGH